MSEEKHREEDDEEISIDFSKITKFFKGKEKPKEEQKEIKESIEEKESDEEEISIDFGKIKSLFKSEKKESKEESKESDEEDVSIDFSKIKNIFTAGNLKSNKTLLIILILIPLLLSVYLRVQPAYLPVTDNWAANNVINFYKNQIKSQVNQKYPNLPDANKNALINEQFVKFQKQSKGQIDAQIRQSSDFFKSKLQDEQGQTYLLAIDPYFWWGHAQNVLENGHPGDEIRQGLPYDNHMIAPRGRIVPGDMFHAYFEAYLFKILSIFSSDLSLMKVAFFVPVLLSALCIIPAFFIARKVGGNVGGFFAATMVAVHPSFLTRTAGGFADTDAYNVLFPLLITWLIIEAIDSKDIKWKTGLAAVAGILVGMYSFAWGGWWHILLFLIASLGLYIIYHIATHIDEIKKGDFNIPSVKTGLIVLIVFLILSGVSIAMFTDPNNFYKSFLMPLRFSQIKEVATQKIWPNVITTVAEQNEASLNQIIRSMGGSLLFLLAIMGIILTIMKKDSHGKREVRYAIILTIWFIATVCASTKGVRWTLLMVSAFSIAFGCAVGIIYQYASRWASKGLELNATVSKIVIVVIFGLLLIAPIKSGYATAVNEIPSFTDAWYDSLTKIKANSKPDAIITSWWDFGHWFKSIADRPVTFDGASQDMPQAHWVGKSLQTDDEDLSMGILRMLDCGENTAFDILFNVTPNTYESVNILYDVISVDKEEAIEKLEEYGIPEEDINNVVSNTHCEPPEGFYITSEDMVGKAGVWGHFGLWNFQKATIYFRAQQDVSIESIAEEVSQSIESTEQLYYEAKALRGGREVNDWISPWPGYVSGQTRCKRTDDKLECLNTIRRGGQVRLEVDLKTGEAQIPTPNGIMYPDSIVLANDTGVYEKRYIKDKVGISVAIIPNGVNYDSLWMSPQLAMSMFTRLFYFKGHGLKHFDLFSDETSVTGLNIKTWKIDWEGKDANIMPDIIQQKESKIEVKASHILVKTREEAEEIIELLEEGSDFADLAQERSLDTGSKDKGGDLGWFRRGAMVAEFDKAVFELEVGELSDIIETQFGYHIITLTGKRNTEEKETAPSMAEEETEEANDVEEVEENTDNEEEEMEQKKEEDSSVVVVS